jgi:hypothetical protein
LTVQHIHRLSPSYLAKLIICPAYVPARFTDNDRLKFQGLHAITVLSVIGRHIKQGWQLKSIERCGNGFRVDLEFLRPDGRLRASEVKCARELTEVHRIQAALYRQRGSYDEVVLSNRKMDVVLPREYVEEIYRQAEATRQLLTNNPDQAATMFTQNSCVCSICANDRCPFLPRRVEQKDSTLGS